jgi:DnaK suppressor protein
MTTPKSAKKKKTAQTKKSAPALKKKRPISPKPMKKTKKPLPVAKAKKSTIPAKAKMKEPLKAAPSITNEYEPFRKTLLEMRGKVLEDFAATRVPETLVVQTEIGDLVDQAGDERDRELSLLLTGREKEKLLAINEALEKLKEGTYGICEECGEKITPGRLKVMPLARSCVNCQQNLEREMSLQRRSEEDMTYRGLAYAPGAEEEEG